MKRWKKKNENEGSTNKKNDIGIKYTPSDTEAATVWECVSHHEAEVGHITRTEGNIICRIGARLSNKMLRLFESGGILWRSEK